MLLSKRQIFWNSCSSFAAHMCNTLMILSRGARLRTWNCRSWCAGAITRRVLLPSLHNHRRVIRWEAVCLFLFLRFAIEIPEAWPNHYELIDEAWLRTTGIANRIFEDLQPRITIRRMDRDDTGKPLAAGKRPVGLEFLPVTGREPRYMSPPAPIKRTVADQAAAVPSLPQLGEKP